MDADGFIPLALIAGYGCDVLSFKCFDKTDFFSFPRIKKLSGDINLPFISSCLLDSEKVELSPDGMKVLTHS